MSSFRHHAFLSYNRHDADAAKALKALLESSGLRVFLDEYDLIGGVLWERTLARALAESNCRVILIGANGLGPFQRREVELALRRFVEDRGALIPVLLPGAVVAQIPQRIDAFQGIQFQTIDDVTAFGRLVTAIHRHQRKRPHGGLFLVAAALGALGLGTGYCLKRPDPPLVSVQFRKNNLDRDLEPRDEVITSMDRLYLTVTPREDAYVYVVQMTSNGKFITHYPCDEGSPSEKEQPATMPKPVEGGTTLRIPPQGRLELSPPAGRERFFVLGTHEQNVTLQNLTECKRGPAKLVPPEEFEVFREEESKVEFAAEYEFDFQVVEPQ